MLLVIIRLLRGFSTICTNNAIEDLITDSMLMKVHTGVRLGTCIPNFSLNFLVAWFQTHVHASISRSPLFFLQTLTSYNFNT